MKKPSLLPTCVGPQVTHYLCAPLIHLPLSEIGTNKMNFSLDFHTPCEKPKFMGPFQSPISQKRTKFPKKFFHIQSKVAHIVKVIHRTELNDTDLE